MRIFSKLRMCHAQYSIPCIGSYTFLALTAPKSVEVLSSHDGLTFEKVRLSAKQLDNIVKSYVLLNMFPKEPAVDYRELGRTQGHYIDSTLIRHYSS